MDSDQKPLKKHRTGCLIPLGLYVVALAIGYFVTRPPLITEDLYGEHTLTRFSIATVIDGEDGYEYGRWTLRTVSALGTGSPPRRFLLPEPEITIYVGDIHHASIIEDHGDWQLIEFNYSNTYMATSIYRAYADRVEPISYQVTASVVDAFMAVTFTMVAIGLYLLAVLINFFRNRQAKKSEVVNRG
ncbi:MAG: hypothetical protein ACR2PS_18405 [Pseudomonadales bacterium]